MAGAELGPSAGPPALFTEITCGNAACAAPPQGVELPLPLTESETETAAGVPGGGLITEIPAQSGAMMS